MLNDMKAKGEKEKHEEMVGFATYKTFCESNTASKTTAIAEGKDAIEQYKADIAKAGADVLTLTKEIAGLTADIDGWKAEKTEAEEIRKKDHADFQVVHADYTQAMDAVDRALQTLKTSPGQFMQISRWFMLTTPKRWMQLTERSRLSRPLQDSSCRCASRCCRSSQSVSKAASCRT